MRSSQRAEGIVAALREPLAVLGPGLCIRSANRAFYAAFDDAQEGTQGRLLLEIGNGQWDVPELRRLCADFPAVSGFDDVLIERDFERLGRRILRLYARELGALGEDGPSILLVIQDVTELLQRADTNARLAAIVDASDDAIISKTLAGILTSWNAGAQRLLGYRAEEIIGKSIGVILPADRLDEEKSIIQRVSRGERVAPFDTVRVTKDGQSIDVSISIAPVRDAMNRIVGATKIMRDIAVRKRLEQDLAKRNEELRAADSSKAHFLAVLSHELRNPLNAIRGWVQVLQGKDPSPEVLKKGLEVIDRNSKAQAELINDLVDVHRISVGKMRLELAEVDLCVTVPSMVDSARAAAAEKELSLGVELEPGVPLVVEGDAGRLDQVLGNLLGNAIKFTPRGGEVRVALRRSDARAAVSITDTGEGISPAALPHVFERFRQSDPLTSRGHGGLGLGLAISKKLVELHGGTITVHSAGKGQGACFTVTLPLLARESARRGPVTRAGGALVLPSLGGILVLVVEDEADAHEPLRRVLEEAGAETAVVASAAEALEALRVRRPDLIVSDIGMPLRDGYDFIRSVRALPPKEGGRIPAIALSAYAAAEDRERALRAGFQAHLGKPIEAARLVATIGSLVAHARESPHGKPGKSGA